MSYFRTREYVVNIFVEMIMQVDDVRVGEGFHDFELSVFVLFVLVDMFDGDFLAVLLQVFSLAVINMVTKYTHPKVPLPTI